MAISVFSKIAGLKKSIHKHELHVYIPALNKMKFFHNNIKNTQEYLKISA